MFWNWHQVWLAAALLFICAQASAEPERVSVRVTSSAAVMLGSDQVGRMGYDQVGLLANAALAYAWRPWFDTQLGLRGGGFRSGAGPGGLFAPTAGLRLSNARRVSAYACFDLGAAVTGELTRPFFSVSGGLDVPVGRLFALGPAIGLDDVVQWNGSGNSTDALFAWVGLSVRYRHERQLPPPQPRRVPAAVAPPAPPSEPLESLPAPELIELIERSMGSPAARIELLAPVLFGFDSDQLEPIGVAMLHEVAHTLRERGDILLVEIEGYADRRGDPGHNQALSRARAERVREWLMAHGIAPERLRVAAHGSEGAVEHSSDETAHQQNRRVVFRVLEAASP